MNLKTNLKIAIAALALSATLVIAPRPAPAQSNPDDAMQTVTGCLTSRPGCQHL